MINLLPPSIKEDISYAKRNREILHFIWLIIVIAAILAVAFSSAHVYLGRRLSKSSAAIDQKQATVASFKDLQRQASALNQRISAIKSIQASQPKFSELLSDLAAATPKNTSINGITLTGEAAKPVRITATATSYESAVSLRDALAASARISGADIESIVKDGSNFQATITIGFKPGQAK